MKMSSTELSQIREWTRDFNRALGKLRFGAPVAYVYNPLEYADDVYFEYWRRFGAITKARPKQIVFMGMNPGPFGMTQTGVPFGEVSVVRDWMKLSGEITPPRRQHPKRPVLGFDCTRTEVSGQRLWGLFSDLYPDAQDFFAKHFVINYCPLVFMSETGANLTPDKVPLAMRAKLESLCVAYMIKCFGILKPQALVGVGVFAYARLLRIREEGGFDFDVFKVIHPSPASPLANRDWAGQVKASLKLDGLVL